ncbi:hypothetical protein PP713_13885 [Mycobacterium sp. CSUR Q5927]|nr:hypothetical protein [Mycobacterium sp. CSUR Q5927]
MGTWATGNVRVETARRVMSVRIPGRVVADGTGFVDATGTRRRLQALRVAGWSALELARQLGCSESMVCKRNHQSIVRASTAAAVVELFNRLQLIPGPSERARRHAARKGWLPPLAFDDDTIDDPAAKPNLGSRVVRFVDRYRDVTEHVGETNLEAIAKRLGMSVQSVIDQRARHREELAS